MDQAAILRETLDQLLSANGQAAKPIVPASIQPVLAVLCTLIALFGAGTFAVISGRSIGKSIAVAAVTSLAGGFAFVFVCDSLGVYV